MLQWIESNVMGQSRDDGDPSPVEDSDLVLRARRGHRRAVERLAARLVCVPRMLVNFDRQRSGILGASELEDLSQDTVLKIWSKLDAFPAYATIEMWCYRFCQFEYLNRLRKVERRMRLVAVDSSLPEQEAHDPEPESVDWGARLDEALDELGSVAELIRLKHFEACTFEEVSERFGIPVNTAKARYYRGIAKLRERLERGQSPGASA